MRNLWSEHVLLVVKMAEGSGDSLVKNKKATSVVWEHFRLKTTTEGGLKKEEKNRPVCVHCSKSVAAKGGNTTNLFTHLRDKHPSVYSLIVLPPKSTDRSSQRYMRLLQCVRQGCCLLHSKIYASIITGRQACFSLLPENVDKLVFLACNLPEYM